MTISSAAARPSLAQYPPLRTWHESDSVASYATNAPHLAANAATDAPHPVSLHPSQLPQQECAGDLPPGAAAASEGFDIGSIVEPINRQFLNSNCGIRDYGEIVATTLTRQSITSLLAPRR